MDVPLRRLFGSCLIEFGQEFIHVQTLFTDSHGNRIMSAAAVIKMQSIQESNRIRMSFYNVS